MVAAGELPGSPLASSLQGSALMTTSQMPHPQMPHPDSLTRKCLCPRASFNRWIWGAQLQVLTGSLKGPPGMSRPGVLTPLVGFHSRP